MFQSPRHLLLAFLVCLAPWDGAVCVGRGADKAGRIEWEEKSEYSHIRVRRRGNIRTLYFVRDNGEEAGETRVNLKRPQDLLAPYTQVMFASHLFQPQPKRVLIVGLGGGAMVRFLQDHEPKLKVDAVEIDPAVVKVADKFFDVRASENVKIITADGLEYLNKTDERYDVIYMDAFLKPSADTDDTGQPLRLKTAEFYKSVQEKLSTGGLVVFNLNTHADRDEDLRTINSSFPQTYTFRVAKSRNLVVVASTRKDRENSTVLRGRARDLDRRFRTNFTFAQMLRGLER